MNQIASNRQYYPALDGLRGIAILMVVAFHNFNYTNYFFFGWLGVDLFFVISGFLITEILLNTVDEPKYLRNFYLRRILRIFPLYYLLLIICLLILPAIPSLQESMHYYSKNQLWYWFYLQNWLYILKPQGSNNLLIHLWSLAVEEQFYLIWPFIILIVRNKKTLLAITVILFAAIMITRSILWVTNTGTPFTDLFLYTRIDGLCLGCSLALLRKIKPALIGNSIAIIVTCFAIMNFIFFFFNRNNGFTFPYFTFIGFTTFSVLFLLLVNESISNENGVTAKLFKIPLLKFFGKISYGFYIIHWPVYKFSTPFFMSIQKNNGDTNSLTSKIISSCLATILALSLSILSYHFFEKRFLQLKKKL